MFFALDGYGCNLRIGGYKSLQSAEVAVLRCGSGQVLDDKRRLVKIIVKGKLWIPFEYAEFLTANQNRAEAYLTANQNRKNWK
jgi:hypothetical protein